MTTEQLKTELENVKVESEVSFQEGLEAAMLNPNITALTDNLNNWFPEYFKPIINGRRLNPVTPQQAVNLAVAYALEDKKEGFPYDHHSRPLLDELLISDSE